MTRVKSTARVPKHLSVKNDVVYNDDSDALNREK